MPLFKVDIEKLYQTEYWTNVYYVEADDVASAHVVGAEIAEIERQITDTDVTFTKYRTSDVLPLTDVFITTPLNVPGLRANDAVLLPLFNVLRADLQTAIGRPSRKYLRGVLTEDSIAFNDVIPAMVTAMNTLYAEPLEGVEELRDVDGQTIDNVTINPKVGMRQLRRGSRRSVTPIVP